MIVAEFFFKEIALGDFNVFMNLASVSAFPRRGAVLAFGRANAGGIKQFFKVRTVAGFAIRRLAYFHDFFKLMAATTALIFIYRHVGIILQEIYFVLYFVLSKGL